MNAFVAVICAFALSLSGCGRPAEPLIVRPSVAQVAQFVTHTGIVLPPSAQAIGWVEQRGMDDALWLQVRLQSVDLPALIASAGFDESSLTSRNAYVVHVFRAFFSTPPKRCSTGQRMLPGAKGFNILIDESNPDSVTVSFMWHET